jgi:hypothetical protein
MPEGTNHICKSCWGESREGKQRLMSGRGRQEKTGQKTTSRKVGTRKNRFNCQTKGFGGHKNWQMDLQGIGGKGNRASRSCCPPSVSSWARPPPGTSCRKSLLRQKSRRGRVLLKHCSTAFRKHWRGGILLLPF